MAMRFTRKRGPMVNFTKLHYLRGASPSRFDIFKHLVLTQSLKLFSLQQDTPWTFVDFSAGAGKVEVGASSEALQTVYQAARKGFENKKLTVTLPLIQNINKINGKTQWKESLTPPAEGQEPKYYPTGAGLADLFLRPQDRAMMLEGDKEAFNTLEATYGSDRRFKLFKDSLGSQFLSAHFPPIHRKGLVYIDVHKGVQAILEQNQREEVKTSPEGVEDHFSWMGKRIAEACKAWPNATYVIPFPTAMLPHQELVGQRPRDEQPDNRVFHMREIPIPPIGLLKEIRASGAKQLLMLDMYMEDTEDGIACLVINPPQGLDHEMHKGLPFLKEILALPTTKKLWRQPRVVWPNRRDNIYDKEAEGRKLPWVYVSRAGVSDQDIAKYEAEKEAYLNGGPGTFDAYMNWDERSEWGHLGHENDSMEVPSDGSRTMEILKSKMYARQKANQIGASGGVVYPYKAKPAETEDKLSSTGEEKIEEIP